MRVTIFALPLLLLLTSVSAAAEWTSFVETENGHVYFVDFSTYKKTSTPRAWFLVNYASRDKFGDMSAIILKEADCREDKWRGISWRYYKGQMGEGGLSTSQDNTGEWVYAHPGSVSAGIIKILCGRK